MSESRARCMFHVRTLVSDGYRYDPVPVGEQMDFFATAHPPLVGDLVHLPAGTFVVVQRGWAYSMRGSIDWPYGESEPRVGPLLTLIVEGAEGPFVNQVSAPEEDE